MVGRLRLWSGYVLLFYVTTHLLNHALGLISLRVVEMGRVWFVYIWQGLAGQTVLYGALGAVPAAHLAPLALGVDSAHPGWRDHSARRCARRGHARGPRLLRRREWISLGAWLPGLRHMVGRGAAVLTAARRVDTCLHR